MKEIWKDIPGFEGSYKVSNKGRMKSFYWKKPRLYKGHLKKSTGYYTVALTGKERYGHHAVGVCVLTAFIGSRPKGFQAAHLNGIKTDNRLENLKWCSPKENASHKKLHGTHLQGSAITNSKLKEKDVRQIKKMIRNGITLQKIADKFKVSLTPISYIKNNIYWKHVL